MKHTHGGDVYRYAGCLDFSANCNPLGTPEGVKKAIIDTLPHLYEYPQVGCMPLRQAIADHDHVSPEHIICGNGAADVIFNLVRASMPEQALIPAPTFAEYQQALESVGCKVSYYTLDQGDAGHPFEIDARVLDLLTEDLDIFFLCNPNNPTGLLTSRDLVEKILRKCEESQILFVLDECFLDFVKEPENYSMISNIMDHPNLFILKAFTKRYGMAGVRLGYGISSDSSLLDKMQEMTQPWAVSTMAQAAGIAALSEKDFVREGRELVFREIEYLKKEFTRIGIRYYDSQANYLFFEGPETLFEDCLQHRVLIRDCSNYPGLRKGFFRIAVKTHEENMQLIQALEILIH